MKPITYPVFVFLLVIMSCSEESNVSSIQPSTSSLSFKAEGDYDEISFSSGNWSIAKITSTSVAGNMGVRGNIFDTSGILINEDQVLTLDSLGILRFEPSTRLFLEIKRLQSNFLEITLGENKTNSDLEFGIDLVSGAESKTITVSQKQSEGYTFENLTFLTNPTPTDSIFTVENRRTVTSNFSFLTTFEVFEGIFLDKTSRFEYTTDDPFLWIEDEEIIVDTPVSIENGELVYDGQLFRFQKNMDTAETNFSQIEEITVVEGTNRIVFDIEFRERKIPYVAELKNNRTGIIKTFEGFWKCIEPTGDYELTIEVFD